ncbi:hypothetical protein XENOCAPTIV_017048, partial [Xenoophorus captivus]
FAGLTDRSCRCLALGAVEGTLDSSWVGSMGSARYCRVSQTLFRAYGFQRRPLFRVCKPDRVFVRLRGPADGHSPIKRRRLLSLWRYLTRCSAAHARSTHS